MVLFGMRDETNTTSQEYQITVCMMHVHRAIILIYMHALYCLDWASAAHSNHVPLSIALVYYSVPVTCRTPMFLAQ